ncbi:Flp pilus assembly protein TadD [Stenotrophomonas sp.]|uniref:TPR domain-containing protein n=1 Tax=Stenotrophomonas sp. TaxID=69392 RepID=UPI0028A9DC6E|nr:Flp pilus assembly protein TadD [Stenotrophomonas sp.]
MRMHVLPLVTLLGATALAGCSTTSVAQYKQDPVSLAAPERPPQDDKQLYLELITQMQRQGAWYASLAHVDAYRQRYGDSPALRLLQADALRETGQLPGAQTLYASLTNGPQAAAAWHGLGLIAVRNGDDTQAEQALARAVQLQPLNTDYLGDLGFARLRAGQLDHAREPLAKAAELAPGNVKANANLAVYALLRNDTATAERIFSSAALPEAARQEVRRLAQQLRLPAARAEAPATVTPPPAPRRGTASKAAVPAPATARSEPRLAPSMLERFGGTPTSQESTP